MAEYFYYFGFLYILYNIIALYDVITFKRFETHVDEIFPTDITPESSMEERIQVAKKPWKDIWKQVPSFILMAISWIWVISGTQISDEPKVFLALIVFSLAITASAFVYAIMWMAKNKKEYIETTMQSMKGGLKFIGKDAPNVKGLNVFDRLIRIGVASYILYIHLI